MGSEEGAVGSGVNALGFRAPLKQWLWQLHGLIPLLPLVSPEEALCSRSGPQKSPWHGFSLGVQKSLIPLAYCKAWTVRMTMTMNLPMRSTHGLPPFVQCTVQTWTKTLILARNNLKSNLALQKSETEPLFSKGQETCNRNSCAGK